VCLTVALSGNERAKIFARSRQSHSNCREPASKSGLHSSAAIKALERYDFPI
jgi:hypothetical protein